MPSATEPTEVRRCLLETAARILGEEGPSGLTVRGLAREAETSTMAVYTHFGSMPALVREIVAEGFARLHARVAEVSPSDDAVDDLWRIAAAYRANALANRHLYAVMFGSASLGGFRLHDQELDVGLAAFHQLAAAIARAMELDQLRPGDPAAVAGQLWGALHGYVMLELAELLGVVDDPEATVLAPLVDNLLAALAEAPRPAIGSV